MIMFIQRALILCKDEKTDDELKTIMATHPWAPGGMVHGFYKSSEGTRAEYGDWGGYDALWVEQGITLFDPANNWVVESFHTPSPYCELGSIDDLFGADARRNDELKKQWWDATVALILHQIPDDYRAYSIFYGELEDEFDHAEETWRESLRAHFDYSPKVEAFFNKAAA
jgi:hypothetical protein